MRLILKTGCVELVCSSRNIISLLPFFHLLRHSLSAFPFCGNRNCALVATILFFACDSERCDARHGPSTEFPHVDTSKNPFISMYVCGGVFSAHVCKQYKQEPTQVYISARTRVTVCVCCMYLMQNSRQRRRREFLCFHLMKYLQLDIYFS